MSNVLKTISSHNLSSFIIEVKHLVQPFWLEVEVFSYSKNNLYLCIYFGLCWIFVAGGLFSSCGERGLLSSCSVQALHCGGFSCC